MRFVRAILLIGACVFAGCNSSTGEAPVGGILPADPSDPVICVGDPDSSIKCKKASDYWDCTTMPNGDVKCVYKEPVKPDGTNTWSCSYANGKVTCTTTTPNVSGGGGWTCTSDAKGTTCEYTPTTPPSGPTGGGNWGCTYNDVEFSWSCQGTSTGQPPTNPTNPTNPTTPPSGGDTICFDTVPGTTDVKPPEGTWAKLTAKKVVLNGVPAIYVRLTLSKAYVDNTYGAGAVMWPSGKNGPSMGKGHSFNDLVESDKNEFFLGNAQGDLVMDFNEDYLHNSSAFPSGYGTLGATGGDGSMLLGNLSDILAVQTSLGYNFNVYGYKLTTDSPLTDASYTPNPTYPNWIFEVWYEWYVKISAFGAAGPGKIFITGLHASPNKLNIKPLPLTPGKCP
jgi:hypothetical protein